MKNNFFKLLILFLAFLSRDPMLFAQTSLNKELDQTIAVIGTLSHGFTQMRYDDEFSCKVYDLYMKNMDYNKLFFQATDIRKLSPFRIRLVDELTNGSMEFLHLTHKLYHARLLEIRSNSRLLLEKPFDFSLNESYIVDRDKRDWPVDSKTQKDFWRQYLKYETLMQYISLINAKKQTNNSQTNLEVKARQTVLENMNKWFDRLQKETEEEEFSRYLNTISASIDPHTGFMPPVSKKDFDVQMTGTFEGIGASLKQDGEFTKVVDIIPGSASWRQKILKIGDSILKVGQSTNNPVDIRGMVLDEIVNLIRGPKGTEVRLTIKKSDGEIFVLPIIRDKVVLEETYAKSAILDDTKNKKRYGYIYLPIFYRDFNDRTKRNSTDDMRKELEALSKEKVDGIILDLRNNGGGALDDAIGISGLFFGKGPVVQVKNRYKQVRSYASQDSQCAYKGPLVVMINSFSASASEIVAAALQDYRRAVVVGGKQSFGKGTVQEIADLDKTYSASQFKPLGFLRMTIQKFYRVNGDSTQLKGVTPDIQVPDLYGGLDVGERNLDYPMQWDTIPPLEYPLWSQSNKIEALKSLSAKRVGEDAYLRCISSNARLVEVSSKQDYPLDLEHAQKRQLKMKNISDMLDKLAVKPDFLTNKISPVDDNPDQKERMAIWLGQILRDQYIKESVNILNDMTRK